MIVESKLAKSHTRVLMTPLPSTFMGGQLIATIRADAAMAEALVEALVVAGVHHDAVRSDGRRVSPREMRQHQMSLDHWSSTAFSGVLYTGLNSCQGSFLRRWNSRNECNDNFILKICLLGKVCERTCELGRVHVLVLVSTSSI